MESDHRRATLEWGLLKSKNIPEFSVGSDLFCSVCLMVPLSPERFNMLFSVNPPSSPVCPVMVTVTQVMSWKPFVFSQQTNEPHFPPRRTQSGPRSPLSPFQSLLVPHACFCRESGESLLKCLMFTIRHQTLWLTGYCPVCPISDTQNTNWTLTSVAQWGSGELRLGTARFPQNSVSPGSGTPAVGDLDNRTGQHWIFF